MIKSVSLHNWRTHAESMLEFGKGTNVLVGAMGSGKSSVMEAICFALFGTFPALQQRRLLTEEVITNRPNEMESALVKVEFDYNGKEYSVERTLKRRGSSEAKLYCGGRMVAGPKPSDVNSAIECALEINYSLFSRAVYSEQNQIDFFLRLSPSERKAKFDELLDLEKYEKARSNAVTVVNRLKGIAEDKRKFFGEMKKQYNETELHEEEKKREEKLKLIGMLNKKIEETKKEAHALEKELGCLEASEKKFGSLKEERVRKKTMLENLQERLDETLKGLGRRNTEQLNKEMQECDRKIEEILKALDKGEKLLDENRAKVNELLQKQMYNKRRIREIEESILTLKNAKASCPVCKNSLDEKSKKQLIDEYLHERTSLEARNSAIAAEAKELNKQEEETKRKLKEGTEEKTSLKEHRIKLQHLIESVKQVEDYSKKIENLKKESETIENEIRALGFDENKLKEKREKLFSLRTSIDSFSKETENSREIILEIEKRIEKIRGSKRQLQSMEQEIGKLDSATEKTQVFTNCLKAAQAELRETLVETINQAMGEIWQRIYPYADFSSAKMEIEEGSYELKVKTSSGRWLRVEGILSGGERSAAAICIRIAFSLVLTQNLGWLILDEPTHNLDSTAVRRLAETMREGMPELVEQVFIITHDKEMEKAASANLYVMHRDKEKDGFTVPEIAAAGY